MLQSPTLAIREDKALAPLLEQAGNAAGQWVRTLVCSGGGFLLDNLPAIGPGGRAAREVARGIHGGLCGLPTPPELDEPIPGVPEKGKCPGVLYNVSFTHNRFNRLSCAVLADTTGTVQLTGPVGNFRLAAPDTSSCNLGAPFIRLVCDSGPSQTESLLSQPGGNIRVSTFSITGITRVDGLPDDCGPPGPPTPPVPPPPLPPPPDIDLPVTPDGGGPDIDFTFSPRTGPIFIGVGGALIVPVNVRVAGPSININAPISIPVNISLPDLNISFPGQGGGGGSPDDPDDPSPPSPPLPPVPGPPREVCCDPPVVPGPEVEVEDDEPVKPVAKGLRLVGIRVSCAVNPAVGNFTIVGQGGGARNLYLPRLANVYFDVRANNLAGVEQPATVGPIPVQLLQQYFPTPEGVLSVSWRVVREPGVRVSVIPLFVPANRT